MSSFSSFGEGFKAYEDGKHRRYELLFAVNGGAFAIAKLFSESTPAGACGKPIGNLRFEWVAYGMVAFTIVMCADIFLLGLNMREKIEEPKKDIWHGVQLRRVVGSHPAWGPNLRGLGGCGLGL